MNNGQGNSDFAHQSITMATLLYNPSQTVRDLAGWRGDTTTDAEASPSIGNDDYRADLDAVNLVERMKDGQSYFSASNDYYKEIDSGKTNRAKEFKENVDIDQAEKTIYDSLVPSFSREVEPGKGITDRQWSDAERAQYLRENYSGSYDFLESVKNGDNNLESYDSNSDYESDKEK